MVASSAKQSDLVLVPESLLKKRHDLDDLARNRQAMAVANPKPNLASGKKQVYVKKPETFISQARTRRNNEIRYHRVLKKGMQKRASAKKITHQQEVLDLDGRTTTTTVNYQANSVGAPMVFAVRIRDHGGAPKMVKKALGQLRLRTIHEGVFLRYDEGHRKLLNLVEPWVLYGPPSKATVKDLIERRGYGRVDGSRIPLSDNTVIEKHLGRYNILCVEDLVHELCLVGECFIHASKFLWPFRLADSKTNLERKTLMMKDGKDYGDRGDLINEYVNGVL